MDCEDHASGAHVHIYTSLSSYQVLQRDQDGYAFVQLSPHDSVTRLGTGGPYRLGDVHDVYVGDLWVLAGQSNMRGHGYFSYLDHPDEGRLWDPFVETPDPKVHLFQSCETWAVANEPLHTLWTSPRLVHHLLRDPTNGGVVQTRQELADKLKQPHEDARVRGTGLGLTFARDVVRSTGVPIGLVPCAHGGVSLAQWDPALYHEQKQGDACLYGAMVNKINALAPGVAGVLWMQGETDACTETRDIEACTSVYGDNMIKLVQVMQHDLGQFVPMTLVYAQIGRYEPNLSTPTQSQALDQSWNAIRQIQRRLLPRLASTVSGRVHLVSAVDLGICDFVHLSTRSLSILGHRMATAVTKQMASPTFVSARADVDSGIDSGAFTDDIRCLVQERPSGVGIICTIRLQELPSESNYLSSAAGHDFVIRRGQENVPIEHVEFGTPRRYPGWVYIDVHVWPKTSVSLEQCQVWYGYGQYLECRLVDRYGLALLSTGPMIPQKN
ncbi:hypothetical protein BZG36_02070 [Bifiguratus adelaidae]|uniref:Sialate O-acetylesterase domain-containing protein n=1 Tax=Bifiguratus adelaidae TaxID=1938954 RepID=A0A261Y388_9FUNG|nr:hypothetical protein BZG36_02070 [Bifiguratus adelaidae]